MGGRSTPSWDSTAPPQAGPGAPWPLPRAGRPRYCEPAVDMAAWKHNDIIIGFIQDIMSSFTCRSAHEKDTVSSGSDRHFMKQKHRPGCQFLIFHSTKAQNNRYFMPQKHKTRTIFNFPCHRCTEQSIFHATKAGSKRCVSIRTLSHCP